MDRVIFSITTPGDWVTDIMNKVEDIFETNGIETNKVDTVAGAWNLNQDWLETKPFNARIEWNGVFPEFECDELIEMVTTGKIIINVLVEHEDNKWFPNV